MTSRLRLPISLSALAFAAVVSLAAPAPATEVQRVVSPGGIEAWLVEEHAIPILSLEIVFRGGASLEPADRGGLANMTSALLDEGAGDMDSQTFQTRLEDLAIHLGFSGGRDDFSGSLKTLAENTDVAFEMLGLALASPRFDEAPVERIRGQLLIGLARKAEDPDTIAGRAWFEAAFPDDAYGRPREGTPESVAAITAEDLRGYVGAQFARDRMLIGVVGDITAERLGPLLDSTFGSLPATGASLDMTPVEPAISGRQIVIERDIPQSVVIFGHKGIARDDPDFYGAYAMNHILGGGGFGSRLTTEVREKRGLAYGVYSYFSPMDRAALFLGRVATQNERVAESLDVIRAEIARMRDEGVSAGELADAKTYLTGSFPLRLDSNDKIARFLVSIQLQDLGIDYIDRRNGYIEAVTLDDVNRLAAELLNPEQLQVVIVGKPDGLTATD